MTAATDPQVGLQSQTVWGRIVEWNERAFQAWRVEKDLEFCVAGHLSGLVYNFAGEAKAMTAATDVAAEPQARLTQDKLLVNMSEEEIEAERERLWGLRVGRVAVPTTLARPKAPREIAARVRAERIGHQRETAEQRAARIVREAIRGHVRDTRIQRNRERLGPTLSPRELADAVRAWREDREQIKRMEDPR